MMIVPRRLYSTVPYEQTTVETLRAEGEADQLYLICPAGGELHEQDAARLGIAEYLVAHPVEATAEESAETKAVEQSTVEDKAVAGPSEAKAEESAPENPEEAGAPGEVRLPRGGRRGS